MPEEWIIDGYNLLHSAFPGLKLGEKKSRHELLETLASFASSKNHRMSVIWDGVGDDAEWAAARTKFFQALYSQSVSADTVIEKILYDKKNLAASPMVLVHVVTNDRAITQMARGFGASVFSTQSFLELIQESKKDSQDILDKNKIKSHGFNRPFHDKLN